MPVSDMTILELEIHLRRVSKRLLTASKQAQEAIDELEERLSSIDDEARQASIDLRNLFQRQGQTLQMMSNVLKSLNDSAMSLIRNVG